MRTLSGWKITTFFLSLRGEIEPRLLKGLLSDIYVSSEIGMKRLKE